MKKALLHFYDSALGAGMLALFGLACLLLSAISLPLLLILPERAGTVCGRWGIMIGARFYIQILRLTRAYLPDVGALHELRGGPPLVLAPNHPSLIDAIFVIGHNPNIACVMKSSLKNNVLLGASARLARYISNDSPRRMIAGAVAEIRRGGVVLLFPEGTRTRRVPVNALKASVGIIAKHAGVPVQTIIIEQDCPVLCKGWPLFRRPTLPITYRIRLGRRFDPPDNVRTFTEQLEQYFAGELADSDQNRWLAAQQRTVPSR